MEITDILNYVYAGNVNTAVLKSLIEKYHADNQPVVKEEPETWAAAGDIAKDKVAYVLVNGVPTKITGTYEPVTP